MAGGCARAQAQSAASPLAEFAQGHPGVIHFTQNFLRVMQKLFARLRERNLFAQPVQKPTADIALERLHRVADGGLREMQLTRRLRKAGGARQRGERAKLPAVQGRRHQ